MNKSPRKLTHPQVVNWIKSHNWDVYTKEQLIKKAMKCPIDALEQFGREIELHVVKIRKLKRKKDEEVSENAKQKSVEEGS